MNNCNMIVRLLDILRKKGWREVAPTPTAWHFVRGSQHFYIWFIAGMFDRISIHNHEGEWS